MATPHARPVAYSDILLYSFYQSVEEVGDVYIQLVYILCVYVWMWVYVCA